MYLFEKYIWYVFLPLVFLLSEQLTAQPVLKVVQPNIGMSRMEVKWDAVAAAQEYEYRRKENAGAYGAWTSNALNLTISDVGLNEANTYTYQVRVKVGGTFSGPSNERGNNFIRVWPVRKKADCTDELVEMLHGFQQPIGAGGDKYFHPGIDMQGDETIKDDCVKSPMGGIVVDYGGSSTNQYFALEVLLNGIKYTMEFNHLKSIKNYTKNTTISPGDTIGYIYDGAGGWNELTSHTHLHFQTDYTTRTSTKNPYNAWSANKYRDPQEKDPEIMDTNGDGEAIRFKKAPNSGEYFAKDATVHNGVDIVAEAVDRQSSNAPWEVPKIVGYYIKRRENGAWVDAVKTSASPFILMNTDTTYQYSTSVIPQKEVQTIIDYADNLKSKAPATPAGYQFDQWFTYVITNTKGTTGARADLDSNQYFATDARKSVAEDNGYKVRL